MSELLYQTDSYVRTFKALEEMSRLDELEWMKEVAEKSLGTPQADAS